MLEAAAIEAVRAAQAPQSVAYLNEQLAADKAAGTDAVKAFQAAMGAGLPDPIPFAQQVSATWRVAQDMNQGIMHRIHALTEAKQLGNSPSVLQMTELQYEVANLSFQQEVVTSIAKKASNAVETLVKNG